MSPEDLREALYPLSYGIVSAVRRSF